MTIKPRNYKQQKINSSMERFLDQRLTNIGEYLLLTRR